MLMTNEMTLSKMHGGTLIIFPNNERMVSVSQFSKKQENIERIGCYPCPLVEDQWRVSGGSGAPPPLSNALSISPLQALVEEWRRNCFMACWWKLEALGEIGGNVNFKNIFVKVWI